MGTGWQQGPQDCTQLTDDQLLVNGEKQPREPGKDCLKLDRKQSSRKRHLIQPRKESPSTSHRTQPRVCRPKDETHLQAPTSHKRTGSPARVGDCHEEVAMGLLELYTGPSSPHQLQGPASALVCSEKLHCPFSSNQPCTDPQLGSVPSIQDHVQECVWAFSSKSPDWSHLTLRLTCSVVASKRVFLKVGFKD